MLQPHRKVSCLTSYIFLYEEKREMATVSAKIFCPRSLSLGFYNNPTIMPRDDISITKHGLKIPVDAVDYDGFVARMKAYVRRRFQR